MSSFCENVREWMAIDKKNVIAVHCKGGKGRTGTIICTWLIDSGLFDEAKVKYFYLILRTFNAFVWCVCTWKIPSSCG